MSREQLEGHLEFFRELGVEGVSRDELWRGRTVRDALPGSSSGVSPDASAASGVGVSHESAQAVAPEVVPMARNTPEASAGTAAEALVAVRADIGECTRCKLHGLGRTQIVFGVGNPEADLMFVGEAPGADEDAKGVPFIGRAGQLLTKIIEAIGLQRDQVYIANVIKCRPPGNRNPEPDEVEQCEPFLFRQIDLIRPKVIVALGKFAAQSLLRSSEPITKLRGREFAYRDAILMPTYHPAYLLRSPSAKRDVWEDMKRVRTILEQAREQ